MAAFPIFQFPAILLIFIACACAATAVAKDCGIPVYWGLNSAEGSLKSTCDSGLYNMVHITSLFIYKSPQDPEHSILFLGHHCDGWSEDDCKALSADILHCQSIGVKLLLNVEITLDNRDPGPAQTVVDYLWHSFLGGRNGSYRRPLGDAALDGIGLATHTGPPPYFYELARGLKEKNVYLSASSLCEIPSLPLDISMRAGLFDSIFIQFMNTWCDYSKTGLDGVVSTWNRWLTSTSRVTKLYFSVPAAPDFVPGFIPVDVMVKEILPRIRYSERFAGLALIDRYWDTLSNYSSAISAAVCDYTVRKAKKKVGGGIKKFFISEIV